MYVCKQILNCHKHQSQSHGNNHFACRVFFNWLITLLIYLLIAFFIYFFLCIYFDEPSVSVFLTSLRVVNVFKGGKCCYFDVSTSMIILYSLFIYLHYLVVIHMVKRQLKDFTCCTIQRYKSVLDTCRDSLGVYCMMCSIKTTSFVLHKLEK